MTIGLGLESVRQQQNFRLTKELAGKVTRRRRALEKTIRQTDHWMTCAVAEKHATKRRRFVVRRFSYMTGPSLITEPAVQQATRRTGKCMSSSAGEWQTSLMMSDKPSYRGSLTFSSDEFAGSWRAPRHHLRCTAVLASRAGEAFCGCGEAWADYEPAHLAR